MPIEGMGITIGYATTDVIAGATFTLVTNLTDVTPPTSGEANDVEVTVHSTTSKRKKYQSGLVEPGEWSFKQLMDKAEYATLKALKGVTRAWCVTFADGSKHVSQSYLKGDKVESPMDGVVEVEWSLKVAGDEVWTPASGS
jgi:VCBS repeat-containing protein